LNSVAKIIHRKIEITESDIMNEIVKRFSNELWSMVREDVKPSPDTMIVGSNFLIMTSYNLTELSKVLKDSKE